MATPRERADVVQAEGAAVVEQHRALDYRLLLPLYLAELAAGHSIQWSLAALGAMGYVAIFPSIVSYLC